MLISPIATKYYYQSKPCQPKPKALPSFKGSLSGVEREIGNVLFMENGSIYLKEPKNLYDGVCDLLTGLKMNTTTRYYVEDRLKEVLKLEGKKQYKNKFLE
ncbi:MAG: hypothetical protein WCF95_04020 [bacterium]